MTESKEEKMFGVERTAFTESLTEAGFKNISDESGVITATVSDHEYETAKKQVKQIAKNSGYELSYGVKKRKEI